MTTNINFYGKPFGAPLLPNKMTSDGWSIADARHIGGHRVVDTVDDLYELYDWQLVNPSALLHNDKSSAAGQKWYVKGDGTYMLKNYDNRKTSAGWVKVEDNTGNVIIPGSGKVETLIQTQNGRLQTIETKLVTNANKPNGVIVLNANGRIPSSASTAFRKINGKSILKDDGDTADITIDLSLFVIPANNELPTTGINPNKIYLIRKPQETTTFPGQTGADDSNIYIEYLYVNNAWEKIGEYKASIDHTVYLKKADAEKTYVKQNADSPATYILNSSAELNSTDANSTDKAASVALLYHTNQALKNSMSGYSPTNHSHVVTINNVDYTIKNTKVDLGVYVTPTELIQKLDTQTYNKITIDNKIKGITASSLGIATLSNTEIDTMFTQIFG